VLVRSALFVSIVLIFGLRTLRASRTDASYSWPTFRTDISAAIFLFAVLLVLGKVIAL